MNVDSIIEKLLSVRGNKPGKQVDLKEEEIKFLIDKSLPIIKEQKMLVELEAPLHVCGDIHGQYYDLLRIFEHCGYPGDYNYLFLGDYVDRGKQSLETVCLYRHNHPKINNYIHQDNHNARKFWEDRNIDHEYLHKHELELQDQQAFFVLLIFEEIYLLKI